MSRRRLLSPAGALLLGALTLAPVTVHAAPTCDAVTAASLQALEDDIFGRALQGPSKVGEEISYRLKNRAVKSEKDGEVSLVWSREISYPDASYIAPHFSRFHLPKGSALIIRSPDGSRSWKFTDKGKGDLGITEGFWGIHIPGDTAVLELWSDGPVKEGAIEIDRFAWGYPDSVVIEPGNKALCGTDDSEWAKCLQTSEATIYDKSRAVARLLINGSSACTGWLVGDVGHLMTNEHCIGTASDAANTDYEFMAEGATCTTSCASFGGCPGTVAATSATFIKTNAILDYTLVQLPTNLTGTYGFLQLRNTGAVVEERIYIPGHPGGWGKKIADKSTHSSDASGKCEVFSKTQPPCSGGSGNDVGYFCDTQGGSSGSPVVAYGDHLVVSLHHCANCPNRGLPIESIITDLGASLPPNAIGGGIPCTPPAAPSGLTATAAGPNQINLSWSAVIGATQYRILRSTTSGGPYTQVGTSASTAFSDTGLACNTTYYYVVRAFAGCESANSNQASATTGACPSCTTATLYSHNFETGSGLSNWSRGTFVSGGSVTSWRGIQACTAQSGTRIFRYGGSSCTANYTNSNFNFAQPNGAGGISVPAGSTSTRLSFWHRRRFESGFDGGTLAVSVDGTNYTFVPASAIISGATFNGTTSASCPPAGGGGKSVFTGVSTSFSQSVLDLDAACNAATGTSTGCAGRAVRIAFTAITDCTVTDDGWFLDDVTVTACVP